MRIAIVSDAWFPQVNGVVRSLDTVRRILVAEGHVVDVFGPDRFPTMPCPTYPEIRLALLPQRRLGRLLDEFAADAIHIATEGPLGLAARRWCLAKGLPFTTSFHTKFPDYVRARTGLPLALGYAWLRRFHNSATQVMVATQSLEDELRARGFRHLVRWSRGADLTLFRPRPDEAPLLDLPRPIFAYVGRVSVEKNIGAFLALDLPGSKLVVGDGPQRADLERRFPTAHFVGAKHGEDLARHYALADVFVFPSQTDTFGLVVLEALACGVPVAAFPVTGPKDVIGTAPVGCLDNDLRQAALGALKLSREDCRTHALTYSWEASAQQFLANLAPGGVRRADVA